MAVAALEPHFAKSLCAAAGIQNANIMTMMSPATHQTIAAYLKDGPTEAELQAAKSNLVGGFALRIDSNRKLLDNVANIAWNRLPLNYLDNWTQQIEKVGVADVRRAMQRVLQPERMVTVVVGAAP